MPHCMGKTKEGEPCHMMVKEGMKKCHHHMIKQSGRGGIHLTLANGKSWKLGSKAKAQVEALKSSHVVVLPEGHFMIHVPMTGDLEVIHVQGPKTLAQLIKLVESFYEERGAIKSSQIVDLADGDTMVALEPIGESMYQVILK